MACAPPAKKDLGFTERSWVRAHKPVPVYNSQPPHPQKGFGYSYRACSPGGTAVVFFSLCVCGNFETITLRID